MKTNLVNGVDDPVDTSITADRLVLRVDQDDFVVLVGRILVDPVGVKHSQVGAATTDTLLGSRLQRALILELVDTLVGRLSCTVDHSSAIILAATFGSQIETYRMWHPSARVACALHASHERGR